MHTVSLAFAVMNCSIDPGLLSSEWFDGHVVDSYCTHMIFLCTIFDCWHSTLYQHNCHYNTMCYWHHIYSTPQLVPQELFEQEAVEYEHSVEKLYPLCGLCEQRVTNEIGHRNHVIRQYLLANSSRLSINRGSIKVRKLYVGREHSVAVDLA